MMLSTSCSDRAQRPGVKIDEMMERLDIDIGYGAAPRFGLTFSCAVRNCRSCTVRDACEEWLANAPDEPAGPPEFCPNAGLIWELLCDPVIGRRGMPSV